MFLGASSPHTLSGAEHNSFFIITSNMGSSQEVYESLHQLIVKNPWVCKGPLFWTTEHLKLLNIRFQPIDLIIPHPAICRSYGDPSIAFGKQPAAALTSEAKRAALAKLFQVLGCGLVTPT